MKRILLILLFTIPVYLTSQMEGLTIFQYIFFSFMGIMLILMFYIMIDYLIKNVGNKNNQTRKGINNCIECGSLISGNHKVCSSCKSDKKKAPLKEPIKIKQQKIKSTIKKPDFLPDDLFNEKLFQEKIDKLKKERQPKEKEEIVNENGFNRKINNSQVSEFYMKNNKYHGTYTQYYPSGEKQVTMEFVDGEKYGKCIEFYKNGIVKYEVEMKNDKEEGKQIERYENGEISFETNYKNGLSEGIQKEFRKDGWVSSIEYHRNDKKITDLYGDNNKEIVLILLREIKKIMENGGTVDSVCYLGLLSSLGFDTNKLTNDRDLTLQTITSLLSKTEL